jgi:hypothetical protein
MVGEIADLPNTFYAGTAAGVNNRSPARRASVAYINKHLILALSNGVDWGQHITYSTGKIAVIIHTSYPPLGGYGKR